MTIKAHPSQASAHREKGAEFSENPHKMQALKVSLLQKMGGSEVRSGPVTRYLADEILCSV
ncbi:hypothetical protein [Aeromonas cavernicola]|uniref:hypothetical protein n=1 Tax=Aeromonas cavernicola TaxID=1006623 RepID=UPI0012FD6156|nr:hypothetical protein [Aeromonas cavernicola]